MKASFLGKEIRGIRRHYAWLRRRLQERDLIQVVKRVGCELVVRREGWLTPSFIESANG